MYQQTDSCLLLKQSQMSKSLQTNALFDVSEFGRSFGCGECLVIGSYLRAIRTNFCTGQEYIGPWVNWRKHSR